MCSTTNSSGLPFLQCAKLREARTTKYATYNMHQMWRAINRLCIYTLDLHLYRSQLLAIFCGGCRGGRRWNHWLYIDTYLSPPSIWETFERFCIMCMCRWFRTGRRSTEYWEDENEPGVELKLGLHAATSSEIARPWLTITICASSGRSPPSFVSAVFRDRSASTTCGHTIVSIASSARLARSSRDSPPSNLSCRVLIV